MERKGAKKIKEEGKEGEMHRERNVRRVKDIKKEKERIEGKAKEPLAWWVINSLLHLSFPPFSPSFFLLLLFNPQLLLIFPHCCFPFFYPSFPFTLLLFSLLFSLPLFFCFSVLSSSYNDPFSFSFFILSLLLLFFPLLPFPFPPSSLSFSIKSPLFFVLAPPPIYVRNIFG